MRAVLFCALLLLATLLCATPLRVVSYNIRHTRGMDNVVNLDRTAAALHALKPDIVGLQEVDRNVTRSGNTDQPARLGDKLGLNHAFGAFMPLQGGEYGMAILSRHPIAQVIPITLPTGNEPRIALRADLTLPSGQTLSVINVHFDWVEDDTFRYAQAQTLARHLRTLKNPYILLGDFNDTPTSRTLSLFRSLAYEAHKPRHDRFTFSSTQPTQEIDFIFTAPLRAWTVTSVRVLTDPLTSDHRPVLAELTLKKILENRISSPR